MIDDVYHYELDLTRVLNVRVHSSHHRVHRVLSRCRTQRARTPSVVKNLEMLDIGVNND